MPFSAPSLPCTLLPGQIGCLKEKLQHEEVRADREEESQARLQGRMEGIEARRRQRDLEKRKGK